MPLSEKERQQLEALAHPAGGETLNGRGFAQPVITAERSDETGGGNAHEDECHEHFDEGERPARLHGAQGAPATGAMCHRASARRIYLARGEYRQNYMKCGAAFARPLHPHQATHRVDDAANDREA